MKKINLFFVAMFFATLTFSQTVSNFDSLPLGVDTFWNGSNLSGGFSNGNAFFENQYDTSFGGYWSGGFIYSDVTNDTTAGYTNSASAITGMGATGSKNYAVAYDAGNAKVILTGNAAGKGLEGVYITNSTYAYLSMKNGDNFEPKFDSSDWFLLTIRGWKNGDTLDNPINFYLADFRAGDSTQHYIVHTWQWVNLLALGNVDSLIFSLSSSKNDSFGMLTPAYFCIDNFTTSNLKNEEDTILYTQDTLINVLAGQDTAGLSPATVRVLSNTSGSSQVVDSANNIWYIPQIGVQAMDTVTYVICNAQNQCDTALLIMDLRGVEGIKDIISFNTRAFPNPFTGTVSILHPTGIHQINVYDIEGSLVRQIQGQAGEQVTQLDCSNLPAGVYLVKLFADEGVGITRIIKQ
jgi:hypothetical protein